MALGSIFECDEAPDEDFDAQLMDTDLLKTTCCTWDSCDPWQPAVVHLRYFLGGMRLSLPMYTCCSLAIFASVPAASHQGSAICDSYAAAASHLDLGQIAFYAGDDAVCASEIRKLSHRPFLVVVELLLGTDQHAADAFRSDLGRLHFAALLHHATPVVSSGRPCPVLFAPGSGMSSISS